MFGEGLKGEGCRLIPQDADDEVGDILVYPDTEPAFRIGEYAMMTVFYADAYIRQRGV